MFAPSPLRRTFAAALRDLSSSKAAVRASAARDLAVAGADDPRSAADALSPLVDDADVAVRVAALDAMGTLDARHLIDHVVRRLDDGESEVRQTAAIALGSLGGERALDALRAALRHRHADVRYQALLGLMQLAPSEGVEVAREALDSDDLWIASEGAEQLGRLLADPRTTWSPERRSLAVEALAARSGDPRPRVALLASMSLLRAGDPRGFAVVARFVQGGVAPEGDDGAYLLSDALELLGEAAAPDDVATARDALERHAWRALPSPTRAAARAALARLGDARAVAALVEQLSSVWPTRREEALTLVSRARVTAAVPALTALAGRGGATGIAAVNAIDHIGGDAAGAALSALTRASDRAVRDAARAAIDARDDGASP
ncbi:MAG: HEAT repeat domain-containing protein [Polyangiales bacterium]